MLLLPYLLSGLQMDLNWPYMPLKWTLSLVGLTGDEYSLGQYDEKAKCCRQSASIVRCQEIDPW